ncbi:glutamate--cysteine ligase, partial [Rhodopseudomonas palustris]
TRQGLRVAASVSALRGEAGGVRLMDLARSAVALSHAGLAARGLGEERFLAPLVESLKTGDVQADRWLAAYEGEWAGSLTPVYEAASL